MPEIDPAEPPRAYDELRVRLAELHDIDRAQAVLTWDERTMMPAGGATARARQVATLSSLHHERLTAPALGRLLDQLTPWAETLDPDSDEAALVRVARRDHNKAMRVPGELQAALAHAASEGEYAWREARRCSDFSMFLPFLRRNVDLALRYVECFPDAADPYDPLLDEYEPGTPVAEIAPLLAELKSQLVPLVSAVAGRDQAPALRGPFPVERQRDLVHSILRVLPMPGDQWRLDGTAHPFACAFAPSDVRLTTSYNPDDLFRSVFSALHEYGHGLYENGVAPALVGTPLARPSSLGLHESQSRTWENMVGHSDEFWEHFLPVAQQVFPRELAGVTPAEFMGAANAVRRSLIRTDADELTYDLHVLVRFELEREIFESRLALADLPEAWNERMHDYLGVHVPHDAQGVLQDPHWAEGAFGYFPTYTLGNMIAAQLWEAARGALPDLHGQLARGDFTPLREWSREHVHRHGRKHSASELVTRVTGRPIQVAPYIRYLRAKFA